MPRSGHGAVLVIRGEPGVGKLRDAVAQASDFQRAQVTGVESEIEHAVCAVTAIASLLLAGHVSDWHGRGA